MKLSKNFSLSEFTKSNTAIRRGLDNNPTAEHIHNLVWLCENILQPLRDELGVSIRVTSGYRGEELNAAIGGSSTSDHCKGAGADCELWINGYEDNAKLFNVLRIMDLPVKQVIWEFGDEDQPSWVHIAGVKGDDRREYLQAYKEGGKTKYKIYEED